MFGRATIRLGIGPHSSIGTYFNDITGCESVIDYFVTNDKCIVRNFEILM